MIRTQGYGLLILTNSCSKTFWYTKGIHIVKSYRPNATEASKQCGNDVTFSEFIEYVIDLNGNPVSFGQDKHWLAASNMCHPCMFKPTYILKQENLMREMPLIMTKLGIDWVMKQYPKNLNLTEFEMEDQLSYVYTTMPRKSCANRTLVLKRLWTAYQYNAYIPEDIGFPDHLITDNTDEAQMLHILRDIRKSWSTNTASRKQQKRNQMTQAYKTLSQELLQKLRLQYMDDFNLFGYDDSPTDIFN